MTTTFAPLPARRDAGDILTASFGATIAMWAAGYVCRIAGVPNWAMFFMLLIVMLAGGFLAGRSMQRTWRGLVIVGVTIGLLNLLILGSVLSREESRALAPTAAWAVPGWIALCIMLTLIASLSGRASIKNPTAGKTVGERFGSAEALALPSDQVGYARLLPADIPSPWPARFAMVAAAATALLLIAGGVVTGFEAGMAVPDWPNTFGYNMFLYPLARMTGGVYFEHSHRLLGSLVGLTTLVLTVYLQFTERRWTVRIYAIALLAAVIGQGILGGLRVVENNAVMAAFHGVFAQVFFAGLIVLVAVLAPAWHRSSHAKPVADTPDFSGGPSAGDRYFGIATCVLVLAQIVIGARLRHLFVDFYLHVGFGILVAALAAVNGLRAWLLHDKFPIVAKLGGWVIFVMALQLLLGFGAFLAVGDNSAHLEPTGWAVAITTAHQTTGAIVLAMMIALALWRNRIAAVAGFGAYAAGALAPHAATVTNEARVGVSNS